MEVHRFFDLIKNSDVDLKPHLSELSLLCEKYPYFQTVAFLRLKSMQAEQHPYFAKELKKTAVMTQNRGVLYDMLHRTSPNIALKHKTSEVEHAFLMDEKMLCSFEDWLHEEPIKTANKKAIPAHDKDLKIIDNFLNTNPKITTTSKKINPQNTVDSNPTIETDAGQKTYMTETLAQVYLRQKHYENAKKAYKILCLKYPEKKAFFAGKISEIENMIKTEKK